ncbi:MAG: PTS sugar transporter subunit IIA [Planctomycetes bacterium]|nr:PTS sugar transporter subunit IIA [Planctomycetota bacterium]
MNLSDLLSEEVVLTPLEASDRDAAIERLIDALVDSGALQAEHRDDAAHAVHQREASQTTGLGGGVAIPHGVCEHVDEVVAALGVLPGGIDFAAIDGAPVQIVVLLLVPPNRFQAHIRTLAGVARLLNDSRMRRQIVEAPSAPAIVELIAGR